MRRLKYSGGVSLVAVLIAVAASPASATLTIESRSATFSGHTNAQVCPSVCPNPGTIEQDHDASEGGATSTDPGTTPFSFQRTFGPTATASGDGASASGAMNFQFNSALTFSSDSLRVSVDADGTGSANTSSSTTRRAAAFGKGRGRTDVQFTITEPVTYQFTASGSRFRNVNEAGHGELESASASFGGPGTDVSFVDGQLTGPASGTLAPGTFPFTQMSATKPVRPTSRAAAGLLRPAQPATSC